MSAKQHYEQHLGNFYSWMVGDFDSKQKEFRKFLETQAVLPSSSTVALDLGCGHGIQSVSLAQLGFKVKAIDFNRQLLDELQKNAKGLSIDVIEDDILNVKHYAQHQPELIVCWGDTLMHLESLDQLQKFLSDCAFALAPGGKLLLSFRDYSKALYGNERFIPVKSDETRILTCCLDYEDTHVRVTDLLYERSGNNWLQKISAYYKVRASLIDVETILRKNRLSLQLNEVINRMNTLIAIKK